jgi:DNA-binding SARP family transcriptional activator
MAVSGYLAARRLRSIWYQVDEGDGDPATFFYYLGLAGGLYGSRNFAPLPLLTPEYLPSLTTFAHRFFESLFVRLGAGTVLVFDNCQKAPAESPFFNLLREGLSRMPSGVTAILVSRSNLPSMFARKRLNYLVHTIDWKELRLTPQETRGIARLRGKRRMPDEAVREVHRRADGWAAGVTLLLEKAGMEHHEARSLSRQAPSEIFEYFAEEIFAGLEKDTKAFLLRSAFLPRMTAGMAQRLTRNERAGRFLSYLSGRNYFTAEKHPSSEPVYEFHALFREYLLSRAHQIFSIKEVQRMREKAASILLEEGWAEDAAEHLRITGNWNGLTQVILGTAPSLIAQGRNRVLSEWIVHLPEEHIRATPWLSYWLGVAILPFEPGNTRRLFEETLARFRQEGDAAGAFLSWSGVVHAVWFEKTGYEYLDTFLSTLEELQREFGGFPSREIEALTLCAMLRGLGLRMPAGVDRLPWDARARAIADEISDIPLKVELLCPVFASWNCQGVNSSQVDALFASLEPLLGDKGVSPIARIEIRLNAAINLLHMAEYPRCLAVAAEALKVSKAFGLHVLDMFLLGQATLAAMHQGEFRAAKNTFRRMAALLPKAMPHDAAFYHYIASCDALERGHPARAEQHWRTNTDLVMKSGFVWVIYINRIMGALVMRSLGNREEARALLAEARRMEKVHSCERFFYFSTLLESVFLTEDGDVRGGIAKMREALQIGRKLGLLGSHFWYPEFLSQIAVRALREGIEIPYVQEMIRKNRLRPPQGDLDLEEWPWPVRIYTLGRSNLVVDGAPPRSGRKVQQKPLALARAIIALGGRGVAEERLCEALWPEADGDLSHHSFSMALNRLRKLLGKDEALELKEGKLTLSDRHCWTDIWAFERLLGDAERNVKKGERKKAAIQLETALSLYTGPFLPGEEAPWAVPMREKMRSRFLRAAEALGRIHEEAGRFEEAMACYREGLETDELAETFHRRLMACLLSLGRMADAALAYEQCRRILKAGLGVEPSRETEAIAKEFRRERV